MPKIYITYRAGDTSHDEALKLSAQLRHSFGDENITLSQTKTDANIFDLYKIVQSHDALLLLVGQRFSTIMDEQGRPLLHDVYDYLFTEIQAAIEKKEMWISVILTDDATMPTEPYLPKALRDLNKRDVVKLYKQHSMAEDIEQLRRRLGMIDAMITHDNNDRSATTNTQAKIVTPAAPRPTQEPPPQKETDLILILLACLFFFILPMSISYIFDSNRPDARFDAYSTEVAINQENLLRTPRATIPPSYFHTEIPPTPTPILCSDAIYRSDMPNRCAVFIVNSEPTQLAANIQSASTIWGESLVHRNELTSCITCHSITVNQDRETAPTLYTIGQEAGNRVEGMSAEEYLYFSLVDPDSYIVEGYQAGQHPNYIDTLSLEEISDIVAYLLTLGTDE